MLFRGLASYQVNCNLQNGELSKIASITYMLFPEKKYKGIFTPQKGFLSTMW
jgi:hypothetical protein